MSYESFTRIGPYYDTLMRGVPYTMWVSYFELLCSHLAHKPRKVLDVCCGTGSMCELLTAKGLELTGVDLSHTMIEAARKKAAECDLGLDYYEQDVAEMDIPKRFDTAFSFFDSLNYITQPEQLRKAFQRVAAHLEPEGVFIFDLNTEFAFVNEMFTQENMRMGAPIRYRWRSTYDPGDRICSVKMEFWVSDPYECFIETHVQRAHSPEEIRAWLAEAGFTDVRAYDSYTLDRPTKRSDRVHYSAIRL
jgi:ubiquinone/menaquinone biosynthesis C-methylase UbiE